MENEKLEVFQRSEKITPSMLINQINVLNYRQFKKYNFTSSSDIIEYYQKFVIILIGLYSSSIYTLKMSSTQRVTQFVPFLYVLYILFYSTTLFVINNRAGLFDLESRNFNDLIKKYSHIALSLNLYYIIIFNIQIYMGYPLPITEILLFVIRSVIINTSAFYFSLLIFIENITYNPVIKSKSSSMYFSRSHVNDFIIFVIIEIYYFYIRQVFILTRISNYSTFLNKSIIVLLIDSFVFSIYYLLLLSLSRSIVINKKRKLKIYYSLAKNSNKYRRKNDPKLLKFIELYDLDIYNVEILNDLIYDSKYLKEDITFIPSFTRLNKFQSIIDNIQAYFYHYHVTDIKKITGFISDVKRLYIPSMINTRIIKLDIKIIVGLEFYLIKLINPKIVIFEDLDRFSKYIDQKELREFFKLRKLDDLETILLD